MTLKPNPIPKLTLKPHLSPKTIIQAFYTFLKPRPKPISAFGLLDVFDAGTGSVDTTRVLYRDPRNSLKQLVAAFGCGPSPGAPSGFF